MLGTFTKLRRNNVERQTCLSNQGRPKSHVRNTVIKIWSLACEDHALLTAQKKKKKSERENKRRREKTIYLFKSVRSL